MMSQIRRGAPSRGLAFEVSVPDLVRLFHMQRGFCAMSGMRIKFGKPTTASLDRIDSALGYAIDNVQWVHKDVNLMKQAFDVEYFQRVCARIARVARSGGEEALDLVGDDEAPARPRLVVSK